MYPSSLPSHSAYVDFAGCKIQQGELYSKLLPKSVKMHLEHRTTGTSSRPLSNEYNKTRKYIPVHPPEESSHECNPWDSMSSEWGNLCVNKFSAVKVYKC